MLICLNYVYTNVGSNTSCSNTVRFLDRRYIMSVNFFVCILIGVALMAVGLVWLGVGLIIVASWFN